MNMLTSKSKKDGSIYVNDPYKLDPDALKLIGKKIGSKCKEQRVLYIDILLEYSFLNIK